MSVLLCCCLLFSVLCLSVSAAEDTLSVSDFNSLMGRETSSNGSTYTEYYTFSEGTVTVSGVLMHYWHANDPSFYALGATKVLTTFTLTDVQPNHNYDLNFKSAISYNGAYQIIVTVAGAKVFDKTFSDYKVQNIKCNFDMPANVVSGQTTVNIEYRVAQNYAYGSAGQNVRYYISENIDFVDRTDNPTWLQKILNRFTALGDTIGGFFGSLGDRISGFFSDLSKNISQWFAEQAQKIQDFKDGVKQWFQELGDKIGGFFTDLYNDLIEGLKALFIPADGYFDAYMQKTKDWAAERFGFLYTAADLMVTMVTDLKGLLRDEFTFVLPAARFTLNGQTYTLWDEYTVPMGEYLQNNYMKFAYGTYKTLLGSVFAFALFKYAQRVFDKVMAN